MRSAAEEEISEFVRARYARLSRLAYLLCGDHGKAEDLVQTTLTKVALVWHRLDENVDHYTHRVLTNTYISARRRRSWFERPVAHTREWAGRDEFASVDDRDLLRRALARLPSRQRAAVVLRHYEDLSEEQTAAVLGCAVGTVKSLTSRGLRSLRADLDAGRLPTAAGRGRDGS
ncbi:SigE family RNA polymerase sigma factor [Micromonospora inyonensis]|uniref:RNA polymerase sigma-70 factor, sigma-E family n=1 Tax=Micromonospora inyonensis TaxID=47866 RepID=A0A1C6SF45_9ACTN|nr:SigE family RNA polymerase sigma factor [Micromonospora inyonensis]SCL28008.1 RNA polymerase sigma-70 factor, sigma-E family [Micromonospora inyonensis]